MKKELLLLLILPLAGAYYSSEELILNVDISNTMHIEPEGPSYKLNDVTVYLSYFPHEDFRQRVESFKTAPGAQVSGDTYIFEWNKPKSQSLDFTVSSRVKTLNKLTKITGRVPFPIRELGPEREYIEETPTIDYTDPRIMRLASDLAEGESDLAVVVHKLGAWVHDNIEYDLNTKTSQASQKASWVIENQYGVCDELTNLFIGLCRSLGIPARFVSGLSYTELEIFDDNWSPHGWAEVYFPGYGWVPYDVTYGELGYIDPTHIKLKDSIDSNKSSTRYEWEGYNVNIRTQSLSMKTEVISSTGQWQPLLELDASFLKEEVGFGSYNAFAVDVYNPNNYYVPAELSISLSQGVEYLEAHRRQVLLKPGERRKEYWLLRLEPGQEKNYAYNFTTSVSTERNATALAHLLSMEKYKVYSRSEIESPVSELSEEQEKEYSEDVSMVCTTEGIMYEGETAGISCILKNTGNVMLSGVQVCLDACKSIDIPISQSHTVVFEKKLESEGQKDFLITAKNRQVTKSSNVLVDVWGRPGVEITGLEYPVQVQLGNNFTIEFTASPKSSSLPQDMSVVVSTSTFEKEWKLDELVGNRRYVLNVQAYSLSEMQNNIKLLISYTDKEGRQYSDRQDFTITIQDPSISDRAMLLLNRINAELKYDIIVLGIAVFVAGMVIGMIFKSRK